MQANQVLTHLAGLGGGLMSDSGLPVVEPKAEGEGCGPTGCAAGCVMTYCPYPYSRCCDIRTHIPCQ